MDTLFKFPTAVEIVKQGRKATSAIESLIPHAETKYAFSLIANAQLNFAEVFAEKYDEAINQFKKHWKIND